MATKPGIKNTAPKGVPQSTQDYVNQQITSYLSTVSEVDIVAKNGVSIVSTVTGTNLTVVDLNFEGKVSDLSDTDIPTLITTNYVLQWNGTSWTAGAGTSISNASITDLSDVENALPLSSFLVTNDTGTSVTFESTSGYLRPTNLIAGDGITKTIDGDANTIGVQLSQFGRVSKIEHSPENFFIITDSNNQNANGKVLASDIEVSHFDNDANYLSPSGVSVVNVGTITPGALTTTALGTSVTLTLDLTNYLTGAGGLLPISRGGTSSSTPEEARTKLGVSYNSDLIQYREGRFQENLLGDNVRLVSSGMSSIEIVSSGTGYTNGSITRSVNNPYLVPLYFLTTSSGGTITEVSTISGTCGFPNLYEDLMGVSVIGTEGVSATVNIYAKKSYINFGHTSGEDGIGFRMNNGDVEVKNKNSGTWDLVNSGVSVQNLKDVNIQGPEQPGNFLIYTGTCYQNISIGGDISVDSAGNASITTGGISSEAIGVCPSYSSITTEEFSQLSGICIGVGNKIQDQLDKKIQLLNHESANNGSMVYYNSFDGGSFPEYSQLRLPNGTSTLVIVNGTSTPEYQDVYQTFEDRTTVLTSGLSTSSFNFPLLNTDLNAGERYSFSQVSTLLGSSAGGLTNVGNQLSLDFSGVNELSSIPKGSTFVYSTLPTTGPNPSKITLEDFTKSIAGRGVSGGLIGGTVSTVIESGTSTGNIANPYRNQLCYFTNIGGTSYLGVYDGTSWFGASLVSIS